MKIEDRKLEIIRWLINIDDESVLDQIDFLRKSDDQKWAALSDEEKKAIKEGLKQLDQGEGISHEKVMRDLREKYSA